MKKCLYYLLFHFVILTSCENLYNHVGSDNTSYEDTVFNNTSSENLSNEFSANSCAVMEFKAGTGVSASSVDGISEIFSTYFRPVGYTMVERTQINKIIAEQGFQQSSLTQDQMVRVGEILNVSKIVLGVITVWGGVYNVDVRVIDVQSGIDVASEGASFSGNYRTTIENLALSLASKLSITQDIATEPYVIYGYLKVFPNDLEFV